MALETRAEGHGDIGGDSSVSISRVSGCHGDMGAEIEGEGMGYSGTLWSS